jgi:acyl-coenzyme A synthetase/AMP-(fatty) acid ligase
MPNLVLTDEQAIQLVEQLPQQQQAKLMRILLQKSWSQWLELSESGQTNIRQIAADKNKNWDEMNEDEREVLIDEILHEK